MMRYGPGYAGGYIGFSILAGLIHLLFVILIIVLIVALLRRVFFHHEMMHRSHRLHRRNSALEILRERYAKGEINKQEFEEKKKDLEV